MSAHHSHSHGHGNGHGNGHGDGHGHAHAPADFGRAFALGVALNGGFVALEAAAGWLTGSLALLADAGHNLSDVAGLLLAWAATVLAKRPASAARTYGYGRATILAALANGFILLLAAAWIVWEGLHRLAAPQPVDTWIVAGVAALGVAVNGATALLFLRGAGHDLNIRGAYLHMLADAGVSLGVVAAALSIYATGWLWLDPAVSLAIAALIAWSAWGLFAESVHLALDGVPRAVNARAVSDWLLALPGVAAVHDLHIWALSTTTTALTVHLVRPGDGNGDGDEPGDTHHDGFVNGIRDTLQRRFGIAHATIQIERGEACAPCRLHG